MSPYFSKHLRLLNFYPFLLLQIFVWNTLSCGGANDASSTSDEEIVAEIQEDVVQLIFDGIEGDDLESINAQALINPDINLEYFNCNRGESELSGLYISQVGESGASYGPAADSITLSSSDYCANGGSWSVYLFKDTSSYDLACGQRGGISIAGGTGILRLDASTGYTEFYGTLLYYHDGFSILYMETNCHITFSPTGIVEQTCVNTANGKTLSNPNILGTSCTLDDTTPAASDTDVDDDGVLNTVEIANYYVPLVNPKGTYVFSEEAALSYRSTNIVNRSYLPTGITQTSVGMKYNYEDDAGQDFDGDGVNNALELALGTNIFVATSNASFSIDTNLGALDGPEGIATADFDGDGNLDLAVAGSFDDKISIFMGNGDGSFDTKVDYTTANWPTHVAVGDFNKDLKIDLAVTSYGDDKVSILLGDGDGTFAAKVDYAVGDAPNSIALADFNRDGYLDIMVSNLGEASNNTTVSYLENEGDGTFAAQSTATTGSGPNVLTVGDFNDDNYADIAVTNRGFNGGGTTLSVLLSDEGDFSSSSSSPTTNAGPHGIATADLDDDGFLDLVVANNGMDNGNTLSVFINEGDGSFASKVDYSLEANTPRDLIVFDVDGDGDTDVLSTTFGGGLKLLLNDGTGALGTPSDITGGGGDYNYLTVGDFDNDGDLDVASANFSSASVSILLNE